MIDGDDVVHRAKWPVTHPVNDGEPKRVNDRVTELFAAFRTSSETSDYGGVIIIASRVIIKYLYLGMCRARALPVTTTRVPGTSPSPRSPSVTHCASLFACEIARGKGRSRWQTIMNVCRRRVRVHSVPGRPKWSEKPLAATISLPGININRHCRRWDDAPKILYFMRYDRRRRRW